jgi:hypothetical protein
VEGQRAPPSRLRTARSISAPTSHRTTSVERARAGGPDGGPGRARPHQGHPLDPRPKVKPIELFEQGKIDAFLGFPPEPQDLRTRHIGHVIVNTAVDRPWSQYCCCVLGPIQIMRGRTRWRPSGRCARSSRPRILCATEPSRAARLFVEGGFTARYDYAQQALSELPYDEWREFDSEDTIRFTPCACAKPASPSRARKRSSPRAPTGAFSTNAIKDYGELPVEDAQDRGQEALQQDLAKVTDLADRLLGEIDGLVAAAPPTDVVGQVLRAIKPLDAPDSGYAVLRRDASLSLRTMHPTGISCRVGLRATGIT